MATLQPLNAAYDAEHHLTQADVDRVNALVMHIGNTRSAQVPKAGDRILYTSRAGDYSEDARIDRVNDDGTLAVHVVSFIPFVAPTDDGVWCVAGGGPLVDIAPSETRYAGTARVEFRIWGHDGPCGNGAVRFEAGVSVWEYKEANPLYGNFTTKHWRKLDLYRFPERTDGDLYRGVCISFDSDEELEQFVADYEGKLFRAPVPNRIILWCYRDELKAVLQAEWDALDAPVSQRRIYNAPQPVKLVKDHERHTTVCYFVRPEFSSK